MDNETLQMMKEYNLMLKQLAKTIDSVIGRTADNYSKIVNGSQEVKNLIDNLTKYAKDKGIDF